MIRVFFYLSVFYTKLSSAGEDASFAAANQEMAEAALPTPFGHRAREQRVCRRVYQEAQKNQNHHHPEKRPVQYAL